MNPMPSTLADYACSPGLDADEIYTIELLIDWARMSYDPIPRKDQDMTRTARAAKTYSPRIPEEHLEQALKWLGELDDWIVFWGDRKQRPVRNLSALQYFPRLFGLTVTDGEVEDIGPLFHLVNLRRLQLNGNRIRKLGPLTGCRNLHILHIYNTPIEGFSALLTLPSLPALAIRALQMPVLKRLGTIPGLTSLDVGINGSERDGIIFDSLKMLPAMPELRGLAGVWTKSLTGLEGFPTLASIRYLQGDFESLAPLASLEQLSSLHITQSSVSDLGPLSKLRKLSEIWIETEAETLSFEPLSSLSELRKLKLICRGKELEIPKEIRDWLEPEAS